MSFKKYIASSLLEKLIKIDLFEILKIECIIKANEDPAIPFIDKGFLFWAIEVPSFCTCKDFKKILVIGSFINQKISANIYK